MGDIKIGEATYLIGRIDTLTQLEIARRFSGALVWAGKAKAAGDNLKPADMGKLLVMASAPMPQQDMDYVVAKCLSAVSKIDATGAHPMREPASGALMFHDTPLPVLMQLVYAVLDKHGLIDFFADPPSTSPA